MSPANVEATRPLHIWTELGPDLFNAMARYETTVQGLPVRVYAPEIGRSRWEIIGHVEGLFTCSLGSAGDVEQTKAAGIRAAYKLVAVGWRP